MLFNELLKNVNSQLRTLMTDEGQVISGKIKSNPKKIIELITNKIREFGQSHPDAAKRITAGTLVLVMGTSGLTGCALKKENAFGLNRGNPDSYVKVVADTMEDAAKEGYMFYVDSKDEVESYEFDEDIEMMLDTAYVVFNTEDIGKKELHKYGTDKITEDSLLRNFERFGNYVKEHMMVAKTSDITDYSNLIEDKTSAAAVEWFQTQIARINEATGERKKVLAKELKSEIYLTFLKTSNAKSKEYEPAVNLLILKMILGAQIRHINNDNITILSKNDELLLFGNGPVDCSGEDVKVVGTSVYALQFADTMKILENKIKGADNINGDSEELREEMIDDISVEIEGLDPVVRDITKEINDARDKAFREGNNAYADEPKLPDGSKNPNYVPPMTEKDKKNLIKDPNHPGKYIIHEKPAKPVYEAPEEGTKTVITDPSVTPSTEDEIELLPGFYYDGHGVLRDPYGNEVVVDGQTSNNQPSSTTTPSYESEEEIDLLPGFYYDSKGILRDKNGNKVILEDESDNQNNSNRYDDNRNDNEDEIDLLPGFYYDSKGILRDKNGNKVILEDETDNRNNSNRHDDDDRHDNKHDNDTEDEIKLLPGFYYDKNGILRDPQGNEVILKNSTSSINPSTKNLVATNNTTEIELLTNYRNALLELASTSNLTVDEDTKGRLI